jgi:hypothetical protein
LENQISTLVFSNFASQILQCRRRGYLASFQAAISPRATVTAAKRIASKADKAPALRVIFGDDGYTSASRVIFGDDGYRDL